VETLLTVSNLDEFIQETKKLIGTEAELWGQPGNLVVTPTALISFLNVLGDLNPLYCDPDYAYRTCYGCVTAPPTFLAAIRDPVSQGAYSKKDFSLANFLSSVEFTWYDSIRIMDRFSTEMKTTDVFAGEAHVFNEPKKRQMAFVEAKGEYRNKYNSLIGRTSSLMSMIPIKRGEELFVDRELYRYNGEEAKHYGKMIEGEKQRGMATLFWEDVTVGDNLAPVVKGPLELAPLLGWPAATRTVDWYLENYYRRAKEAPGEARVNPVTNWPYWVEQLEFASYHTCKLRGVAYPFAPGMLQACLAGHLLSNWMSDDGFLRMLKMEIHDAFMYGDFNVYKGEVVEKYKEEIKGKVYKAVNVKIDVSNQLGQEVGNGEAILYLPSPGHEITLPIPHGNDLKVDGGQK
jgi:hypothetical protein